LLFLKDMANWYPYEYVTGINAGNVTDKHIIAQSDCYVNKF